MTKQRLSDVIKDYYESQSLDDGKLDSYQKQLEQRTVHNTGFNSSKRRTVMAMVSVFFMAIVTWQLYPTQTDIGIVIAQEVAKNHIKMKPLEVKSDQITDLRNYFTQLDFALIESDILSNKTLQGARYCSIQGITAAQFRYQGEQAKKGITVYEVDYQPELFGEMPDIEQGMPPRVIELKGLRIELWVEKGLLLVSAQEQSKE